MARARNVNKRRSGTGSSKLTSRGARRSLSHLQIQRRLSKKPLRDLGQSDVTVRRYRWCTHLCIVWWAQHLLMTSKLEDVDNCLREYIEACWVGLEPYYLVLNAMVGLEHLYPSLKNVLFYSRHLLHVWQSRLPPARASPFTPLMALGIAGM